MQCLDDNAVSEFVSGALPPSALTKVEGHLAGCRDCRALVAALARDAANDSNVATVPVERMSPSQAGELPRRKLTVGDRVGRYLVLSTLGTGGMGVVFAAYDPQLDRKVALKLLRSGNQYNTRDAQQRLRREAQAIAQLSHPNVVGVYDVGATDDGDLYIAMEFVEGDTLTTWLRRWPRTWREIIEVFLQAGRGLVAAHSVGLLHRDFKPDNVLVGGDGRVRVTDFGLARSLMIDEDVVRGAGKPSLASSLNAALTATGTVLGTPRYMPPEQLLGPNIDARSDQFSYCVALFEALFGEHPLPGATSVSMLEQGDKAGSPPEGTRVPSAVIRALARGLERDPIKRFPTMASLMNELIPPAPRVTSRYVIGAFAGVVIVGASMAAVLSRRDTKGLYPRDPGETDQWVEERNKLIERINKLEHQRDELQRRVLSQQDNAIDFEKLNLELKGKDDQIQALREAVVKLQRDAVVPRPPKKPGQYGQVTDAVFTADRNLEGCMLEWSERHPHLDALVVTRLVVGSDGVAHSATASGLESESTMLCIRDAIAGVRYPPGPAQLDLEVTLSWSSDGVPPLLLTPKVVGSHDAPAQLLDVN